MSQKDQMLSNIEALRHEANRVAIAKIIEIAPTALVKIAAGGTEVYVTDIPLNQEEQARRAAAKEGHSGELTMQSPQVRYALSEKGMVSFTDPVDVHDQDELASIAQKVVAFANAPFDKANEANAQAFFFNYDRDATHVPFSTILPHLK